MTSLVHTADVHLRPDTDERLAAPTYTIDGLQDLAADLDDLVDEIEWHARVSKKAINILDTIESSCA